MNDRRNFLKLSAAMLGGAAVATSSALAGITVARKKAQRIEVAFPKVSRERVLRTTVGLRPHRPTGFRLGAETIGSKTIVHNYGHGGSGWSLSWGTGTLAVEEAIKSGETDYAVLGSGVVGLAAARLLQRRGRRVTIYTKETPPYVTSSYASAGWSPTATLCDPEKISPEFGDLYEKVARIAHRHWVDLIGQNYGVHYREGLRLREQAVDASARQPDDLARRTRYLVTAPVELSPDEHPFGDMHVTKSTSLRYEVHTYLDAVMRDFARNGGRYVIQEFDSFDDIDALPEKVVINCLGLGAKAIFHDEEMTPIRGQLTLLAPQPEMRYSIGLEGFNAAPRYDAVTIGNTMIHGEWSTEPDMNEVSRVVEGTSAAFAKLSSYV